MKQVDAKAKELPKQQKQDGLILKSRPSNRGKKLRIVVEQPLSSLTQRPTLWPLVQFDPDCEFVTVGKRKVIRKKQGKQLAIEEDPYFGISIEDIWKLPEKYEDLLFIEPFKSTFRSRHTQLLSREFMRMIEELSPWLRSLNALSTMLQENEEMKETLSPEELSSCQETTEEMYAVLNEYIERIHAIRGLLIKAYLQKKQLAMRLNIFRE